MSHKKCVGTFSVIVMLCGIALSVHVPAALGDGPFSDRCGSESIFVPPDIMGERDCGDNPDDCGDSAQFCVVGQLVEEVWGDSICFNAETFVCGRADDVITVKEYFLGCVVTLNGLSCECKAHANGKKRDVTRKVSTVDNCP